MPSAVSASTPGTIASRSSAGAAALSCANARLRCSSSSTVATARSCSLGLLPRTFMSAIADVSAASVSAASSSFTSVAHPSSVRPTLRWMPRSVRMASSVAGSVPPSSVARRPSMIMRAPSRLATFTCSGLTFWKRATQGVRKPARISPKSCVLTYTSFWNCLMPSAAPSVALPCSRFCRKNERPTSMCTGAASSSGRPTLSRNSRAFFASSPASDTFAGGMSTCAAPLPRSAAAPQFASPAGLAVHGGAPRGTRSRRALCLR